VDVRRLCALALAASGCYGAAAASADVNDAWRGRTRGAIEGRWGKSRTAVVQPDGQIVLTWSHLRHDVELPAARARLDIDGDTGDGTISVDGEAWARPGSITPIRTDVVAFLAGDEIARVEGPSARWWTAPDDANLRWGVILGLHAGFGALDDTPTPLPSGGAYLGGMLGPRFGLVGCFSLASGLGDGGGAMGFAWGMGAQWWPLTRLWVRAGPALVLGMDPGFEDPELGPGALLGASFAALRAGKFVLDLRLDLVTSTAGSLATAGVGVNLN
jgi:hypothetical protein